MTLCCKRCGYEAPTTYKLRRHYERTVTCAATKGNIPVEELLEELNHDDDKPYSCKCCGKKFSHASSMYRHHSKCIQTQKTTSELQAEIEELKRKLAEATASSSSSQANNSTITNGNIAGNNNTMNATIDNSTTNIHITLNNFGHETYDHINDEFLIDCITGEVNGVRNLIEKIHFSDDAPENNNVRMKSLKRNLVEVVKNNEWTIKNTNDAIETMISKSGRLLHKTYQDSGLYQRELDEFDDRLSTFLRTVVDKDSKQYKALRSRVLACLAAYREQ
jgi:hypothetical protein